MPRQYTQEQADSMYRTFTNFGKTPEWAEAAVQQQTGLIPRKNSTAAAAAPAPQPPSVDEQEQAQNRVEEKSATLRATNDPMGDLGKWVWKEIRDVGSDAIAAARPHAERVKKWATDARNKQWEKVTRPFADAAGWYQSLPPEQAYEIAVRLNRVNNFVELTGAPALSLLEAIHQTGLAVAMWPTDSMDWAGVKRAAELPRSEGTMVERDALRKNVMQRQEQMDQVDAIVQSRELARNNGVLLSEAVLNTNPLDMEPFMMERLKSENRLLGADVVDAWSKQLGGGDVGEVFKEADWAGKASLGLLASAVDYLDPLMLAEGAPFAFRNLGKVLPGRPWQRMAGPLAEAINARNAAVDELLKARKALDHYVGGEPTESSLKALRQAEAKYLNIETQLRTVAPELRDTKSLKKGVDFEKIGRDYVARLESTGTPVIVKGPPRRAPETVLNRADDGPTPSEFYESLGAAKRVSTKLQERRRVALARQSASDEFVDKNIRKVGWRDRAQFENDMRLANTLLKQDNVAQGADIDQLTQIEKKIDDVFGRWRKLPAEVKEHLDIMGWSKDRIMRQHALRQNQIVPEGDLTIGHVADWRAWLGADDGETLGEATKRVLMGARPEDVTVPGALVPEYSILQQGRYPKFADGEWARGIPVPNRVDTESGLRVYPDKFPIRMGRAIGGLRPGEFHLRSADILLGKRPWGASVRAHIPEPLQAMGRDIQDWMQAGKEILNMGRQPSSALEATSGWDIYRSGQGNYLARTIAQENWFERVLQEARLGKRNSAGRFVPTGDGEARGRLIFQALDTPQGIELDQKIRALSPGDQKAYFQLRRWFDAAADELQAAGMDPGMRVSGYAPHIFPHEEMMNGARPLEFMGMPLKAEVAFNHLLPREGGMAYTDNLFDVWPLYNRGLRRKLDMEPTFEQMLGVVSDLRDRGDMSRAQYLEEFTRVAKGYPLTYDQHMNNLWGRAFPEMALSKQPPGAKAAMTISSLYYTGLLADNMNYFLQNLGTAMTSVAARHGALHTARGVLKMLDPGPIGQAARQLAHDSGVTGQMRHAMQALDDTALGRYVEWIGRHSGIEQSEIVNRGFAFHASLSEQLNHAGMTWEEAVESGAANRFLAQAVLDAEFTQHVYGRVGRSPYLEKMMGRAMVQTTTQFLSFPFKHGEMLLRLTKENPGYAIRYMAYSGIIARQLAEAGVDATGSVGGFGLSPMDVRFQAPMMGGIQAGVSALSSLVDASKAQDGFDPKKAEEAWNKVLAEVNNMAPGVKQAANYSKGIHDYFQGYEAGQSLGERERNVQKGLTTKNGDLNPELLPTLLNLRKMERARYRADLQQAAEQEKVATWQINHATKQVIDAYERGDKADMNRIVLASIAMGLNMNVDQVLETHEVAALYERMTRDIQADPTKFPEQMWELMRRGRPKRSRQKGPE